MSNPWEECPSYDACSVNACPLHPNYLKLRNEPGDPETKCHAQRAVRERIAAKYPGVLLTLGVLKVELTADKRSLASKARWNALSSEQQADRRRILKEHQFKKKVK